MHILVPFSFSDKKAVQNMGGKMPDHQGVKCIKCSYKPVYIRAIKSNSFNLF